MKLKPFGSLCLIKILPEAEEKATMTGIIMPSTVDQSRTPRMCEVVATGPDVARPDSFYPRSYRLDTMERS